MRKKKPVIAKVKRRNPVAQSPLLRKGGIHQKKPSAARHKAQRELQDEVKRSIGD